MILDKYSMTPLIFLLPFVYANCTPDTPVMLGIEKYRDVLVVLTIVPIALVIIIVSLQLIPAYRNPYYLLIPLMLVLFTSLSYALFFGGVWEDLIRIIYWRDSQVSIINVSYTPFCSPCSTRVDLVVNVSLDIGDCIFNYTRTCGCMCIADIVRFFNNTDLVADPNNYTNLATKIDLSLPNIFFSASSFISIFMVIGFGCYQITRLNKGKEYRYIDSD